ncbi:hypothetical protein [Rhizobium sp. L1K21]|uniref:hypothetical protein n=1 Tax=Rhizobium sp. L1K21 TaxID=2954933 RepID=UPI002092B5D9|nr:hypothetical protein [Rhizobium sp. L1K21]MCO6186422.1 hypothetical protein [Rhizobium sp. L1K21]
MSDIFELSKELFTSFEFWAGAVLLATFQVGKFGELNALDENLSGASLPVPNLGTKDFMGRNAYWLVLLIFVIVTFVGYLVLCIASPSVISGWLKVTTGVTEAEKITQAIESTPYSLFIAAAFMGLAHQAIPGVSNVANILRNWFHELFGVPRIVIATISYFDAQIVAQANTQNRLVTCFKKLSASEWVPQIEPYADVAFFRQQAARLNLDRAETREEIVQSGSVRELSKYIEQLVYISAIASVRKSGGAGLKRLAKDLGVDMPKVGTFKVPLGDIMFGLLTAVGGIVFLWLVIPILEPALRTALNREALIFWPNGDLALQYSGIYVFSNVVPVLMSLVLMLSLSRIHANKGDDIALRDLLIGNAGIFTLILFGVILFDYCQALLDYGLNQAAGNEGLWHFFSYWFPFNALHAFISVVICLAIMTHIVKKRAAVQSEMALTKGLFRLVVMTLPTAAFYALVRMFFVQKDMQAFDYLILVILLNVYAALLAFAIARSIERRHQVLKRQEKELKEATSKLVPAN